MNEYHQCHCHDEIGQMYDAVASLQLPEQRRYLAFILEGVQDVGKPSNTALFIVRKKAIRRPLFASM